MRGTWVSIDIPVTGGRSWHQFKSTSMEKYSGRENN